ncbi:hypothetical protein ACFSKU_19025 [Pontibacter silvestris]|uniref:3D domain-containing protein n=1 Tax=Pontibacter silvestris TaxID=2305183 RepID=A0ABW4X3U9_9BACT|nr:hypothetical protein [Pontibacter silvestris]MCC9135014.1 hypothetical protein [Pontibacter silvestris]
MFRYKLLAVVFSVLVALAEEFSLLKAESPSPKIEQSELDWPIRLAHHSIEEDKEVVKEDEPQQALTVSASVYYPVPGQTDGTPFITADGSKISKRNPGKHRWIAVSRDLHSRWGGEIDYGDSLLVTGISDKLDGLYIVRDVMNRRIKNRIDILVGSDDDVMGFWKKVNIAKM